MRQLPAPFSTEMVKALLENRKTMTRRTKGLEKINALVTKGFYFRYDSIEDGPDKEGYVYFERLTFQPNEKPTEDYRRVRPKYLIGDHIWVREEHRIWQESCYWFCEYKDGTIVKKRHKEITLSTLYKLVDRKTLGKYQRAMFMPKDFSRIWLECTGVRCERLHDITEADAVAEGIGLIDSCLFNDVRFVDYMNPKSNWRLPITSFQSLWAKINGIDAWDLNPWVFVYEFKRIEKP